MTTDSIIQRPKKVTFSDITRIFFIPQESNDKSHGSSQEWYHEFELLQIRRHAKSCLLRSRMGLHDCDEYSSRGLERLVCVEKVQQCQINRDCVIHGVLKEQETQKSKSLNFPDEIANISYFHSRWAVDQALKIAKMHEYVLCETNDERQPPCHPL